VISLEDVGFEPCGESVQIELPTFVEVTKTKRKSCNLNEYRNLHHHLLNKQKINFKAKVKKAIEALNPMDTIAIHYTIYAQRNGRMDTMNVGSVIDKYFSDALVELNKLRDDDYTNIVWISFSFGGVSKGNPHAIATITPVRKKADMRILLEQTEVIEALLAELTEDQMQVAIGNYVRNTIGLEPKDIVISNDDELSVEIFAGPSTGSAPVQKTKAKPKTTRTRKPKPTPEKEPEDKADVDGSSETGSDDSGKGTGGGADTDAPAEQTEAPVKAKKSALFDNDEETATKTDTTEKSSKGGAAKNLFTDEENQSSSDQSEEGTGDAKADSVKTDKASIFDV
jgi:hypothetical protein